MMMDKAKIVETHDDRGNENGFLMELEKDGKFTRSYLTSVSPGCMKGYHLHTKREANYLCVRGKLTVEYFQWDFDFDGSARVVKRSFNMSRGDKLHIPIYCPTALFNYSTSKAAWLINYPNPYYNPDDKEEQLEFTAAQCLEGKFPLPPKV